MIQIKDSVDQGGDTRKANVDVQMLMLHLSLWLGMKVDESQTMMHGTMREGGGSFHLLKELCADDVTCQQTFTRDLT